MKLKRTAEMILCGLALLMLPKAARAGDLLVNGGFETVVDIGVGEPTATGSWAGDPSEIVPASDGITPFEGSHMLNFIYAEAGATSASSHGWAQVWQLVDVTPFSALISTGQATVSASARFNRVTGGPDTDTRFVISIYAYGGDPSNFPDDKLAGLSLASNRTSVYTDGDTGTWELAEVELVLENEATDTTYIAACLSAVENIHPDDTGPVEFDGHYGDGVTLTVVPEPAALSLLALGAVAILKRKGVKGRFASN